MAQYTNESKCVSYLLRHGATKEKLPMTKSGYVLVTDLISKCAEQKYPITEDILKQIVAEDSKGRYSFSEDGLSIRANQGHSIDIDLGLKATIPPVELFHGTSMDNIDGIKKSGIIKMSRQHVHLSADIKTAFVVGRRHGKPAIILVDCKKMVADGIKFYQSENGVWLTDEVEPKYFKEIISKHSFQ